MHNTSSGPYTTVCAIGDTHDTHAANIEICERVVFLLGLAVS